MHRLAIPLALAVLAGAALPANAGAALTIQPNDPFLGFPASVTDTVSGVALGPCQDASGNCLETPAPDLASPLSVPGNFTPDGEAFYNEADATVPNAGLGLALFAVEMAFDVDPPAQGHQIMFARIRFRFTGLKPGVTYRVTHPFGVDEFAADGAGIINTTSDTGCLLVPDCPFSTVSYGAYSALLRWDPTVPPAAPAGYVGSVATPHAIVGSPLGTNFVRLEELDGPGGLPVSTVGETSSFNVQGKLAGPPPAPAPFPIADTSALKYPTRQVGTASAAKAVTIANHGTADLLPTAAVLGGTDPGDFSIVKDGCGGATVAPAASCTVEVAFAPTASGDRSATLTVADNSATSPQVIALGGSASPPQGAAPPAVVLREQAPAKTTTVVVHDHPAALDLGALRVTRLSVARRVRVRVASRGMAVNFIAPAQANVVRLRLLRGRRAVATKLVALSRPGAQTLHLRARGVRAGRYVVEVTPGVSARALGRATTASVRVVR
jgi:hypothetical protein